MAFTPIKQNPLNFIIQKGTELGIQKFIPILSERTSVKDINILIANDNYLSDLRNEYFFKEIKSDGTITALCSRKMRKFLPWQERKYWNGEMTLKLEVLNGAVFLRVSNFKSSNGLLMPENLLQKWRSQDQLELYKNDDHFADSLKKINNVRFYK